MDSGIHVPEASSSKNAGLFLRQIRLDTFAGENGLEFDRVATGLTLLELFDADISGRDFGQGKPRPEIFRRGKELGVPLEECFVVEDAVPRYPGGRRGADGRAWPPSAGDEELLAAAEPDVLVSSPDHVDLDAVAKAAG